jgi:hypothetical protein
MWNELNAMRMRKSHPPKSHAHSHIARKIQTMDETIMAHAMFFKLILDLKRHVRSRGNAFHFYAYPRLKQINPSRTPTNGNTAA